MNSELWTAVILWYSGYILYILLHCYKSFGGTCCFHLQVSRKHHFL